MKQTNPLIKSIRRALELDKVMCIGINCNAMINNNGFDKVRHLKTKHPNFYALSIDSLNRGEIIDLTKLYA